MPEYKLWIKQLLKVLIFIMLLVMGVSCCSEPELPVALSNDCSINSFSFKSQDNTALTSDVIAIITDKATAVTLPYGTNRSNLKASLVITGSSVAVGGTAQTSGITANDFSNGAVVYKVTAADGTSADYGVLLKLREMCR